MNQRSVLYGVLASCILVSVVASSFRPLVHVANIKGAYITRSGDTSQVILFTDGYFSQTGYANQGRTFLFTKGGPYQQNNGAIQVKLEYDTRESGNVGTNYLVPIVAGAKELNTQINGRKQAWQILDDGTGPLAGAWHITQRMQEGKLQTIHQTGTRKTIKLLTGSQFQWVAIDPGVRGFYGTGGGNYTFRDGKYSEHIAFFSRDSSRVGASLQFNGKVENSDWHHSGKSSKGDDIYEVWSRANK
jgi:hypothetical protein